MNDQLTRKCLSLVIQSLDTQIVKEFFNLMLKNGIIRKCDEAEDWVDYRVGGVDYKFVGNKDE